MVNIVESENGHVSVGAGTNGCPTTRLAVGLVNRDAWLFSLGR